MLFGQILLLFIDIYVINKYMHTIPPNKRPYRTTARYDLARRLSVDQREDIAAVANATYTHIQSYGSLPNARKLTGIYTDPEYDATVKFDLRQRRLAGQALLAGEMTLRTGEETLSMRRDGMTPLWGLLSNGDIIAKLSDIPHIKRSPFYAGTHGLEATDDDLWTLLAEMPTRKGYQSDMFVSEVADFHAGLTQKVAIGADHVHETRHNGRVKHLRRIIIQGYDILQRSGAAHHSSKWAIEVNRHSSEINMHIDGITPGLDGEARDQQTHKLVEKALQACRYLSEHIPEDNSPLAIVAPLSRGGRPQS